MIKTIQILLILISIETFGQDFDNLSSIKLTNLKDCQNYKADIAHSADYILSIPLDFNTDARRIISNFLLQWTGVAIKNGFEINDNISRTIKIDENLMSVYLACLVKSTPNDFSKIIEFDNIENSVITNYVDYCQTFESGNKELIRTIKIIKTNTNFIDSKPKKAPNRIDDNGLKQGLWKEYFPDEKFEYALINYRNDTKDGKFSAYLKNNNLYMIGNYRDDKLNGTHIIYYPDGQVKIKRNFENGLQSGTKYTYNEDGSIFSIVNYKDDKLHGPYYRYDDEGGLKWHAEYENGEEIKVTKVE